MNINEKPLVSVIVPIYKVEAYLEKCVTSIINQTIRDIEIVLVDDGSPDRCGILCDEFAKKDSRITVIHKENGGLSDARNVGIEAAKGNIVALIDSDDYIESDMLEFLYNNMIKADADISVCGLFHHFGNVINSSNDLLGGYYVADTKDAIRLELTEVPVTAVNKLYKRSLFKNVHFPKGKIYEDAHTMIPVLIESKRVVYDLQPKYHYIHREHSITTQEYRPEVLSLIEANKTNMDLVLSHYPDLKYEAEYRFFWSYFWILEYILRQKKRDNVVLDEKKKIMSFLRKNTIEILKNPYFTRVRKVAAILLCSSEFLYEQMAILYMKRNYSAPSLLPDTNNEK